ncbi:LptF/LptG family permease [Cephaloticoccus capnophilus]|uniref:LptF/LptG family permease n=1 Tax=Cephaloticoccus capnophilus TaxID=1548208 RepID=UPI0009EED727|nr:LptF/LptG family permease [Cephaloticoccus capnophilus]
MNLLDRYLFRHVLGACLAAVGLFGFVLLLGNAIRDLLGGVLAGQLPALVFLKLLVLLVPYVAAYALPMGILTGVLLTLGRLSADSEITAMRAAGISVWRLSRAIFALGLLGSGLGLYLNFEAMPRARTRYQHELAETVRANPLRFIIPRTFIRDFPGFVVYVGEKEGAQLRDFWLWELDAQQRVHRIVHAENGQFDFDEEGNALLLSLHHVQVESRDRANPEDFSKPPLVGTFERTEQVRLPLDSIFARRSVRQKLKWLSYSELRRRAAEISQNATPEGLRQKMELRLVIQEKQQNALAILSFALIGIPLGIRISRRETSANLGIAVALSLGYYFLTVAINWLDRSPELRPDLLLWLPNLLCLGLAALLFRRIGQN